jgi:hypothetical protein
MSQSIRNGEVTQPNRYKTGQYSLSRTPLHSPRHICMTRAICIHFCSFKTRSGFVDQAGFKPMILLPQPPDCWDYRYMPPCLALYYQFSMTLNLLITF